MSLTKVYRALTGAEISILTSNGCSAENWSDIMVSDGFDAARCRNLVLSGSVRIGAMTGVFERPGGVKAMSGLSNAVLHNCVIGDGVYINNVANFIANYDIADRVFIENVNRIVVDCESTFGIGTQVSVLNETGGREVPVYPRLSAQIAYLIAMYRHNPLLVTALCAMIAKETDKARSTRGRIAANARIVNTGEVRNVNIGAFASVDGASRLVDGTIVSSQVDPVVVGANVMAEGFILSEGAHIEDGVVLHHCFVGQGCRLSHLFSAHDSLFFANCACENGEAAAIFAGPYTVTMHKSSLLIAGMFSFLNAGSGSNQSNHMYKLGPIHQGVVDRGSKTTSDSYVLWPARIGAFSLVMGRHVNHPDTSALPFSYLIESYGRSYLVPGVNIKSVGTIRDARKWPQRDRRRTSDKLDSINFNLLSPYTASRMMDGINLLDTIEQTAGLTADCYSYRSMTIDARALRKGREYYRMAVDKFMGNSVIHRLRGRRFVSDAEIVEALRPTAIAGEGEWSDISGMLVPKAELERLAADIISNRIADIAGVEKRLRSLADDYYDMEWTWVVSQFARWYGKEIEDVTAEDIRVIVDRWRTSVVALDNMLYEDARKEFSLVSRIGFGADGSTETQDADFEQVRGDFEGDSFVRMVLEHIEKKQALGEDLLSRLP